jgi:anti-anti-sigma factor
MSLDELSIQSERIENVSVIKFQGNINSFTSQRFLEGIKTGMKHGPVILDLEEVNMVTSQGVNAFRELADMSYSSRVRVLLLNLSHSVKQVFLMTGIRNLFLVPDNEESAMKIASRPYR